MTTDLLKLPLALKREFLDRLFDIMIESKTVEDEFEAVVNLVAEYEAKENEPEKN